MAKFYGKNKKGVRESVLRQAQSSLGLLSFKVGGRLRTLLEVVAELFYSLKTEDLEGLLDQVDYTKATGSHLQQLALSYGIAPRSASKAQGRLLATAKKAGTLKAGSWLVSQNDANLRFKVTEDVSYSVTGTVKIPVEAEFAGSKYNLISGSAFRFSSVNLDLTLRSSSVSFPAVAGRDSESDAMLRRRIAARFTGAFAIDLQKSRYEDIIYTSFPDVEQAQIVRVPRGAGSVDICVKTAAGLPAASLLAQISAKLQEQRLLVRDLQVLAPRVKNVDIMATVANSGDVEPVKKAFKTLLDNLLIAQDLSIQKLYQAIENFSGVEIRQPSTTVIAAERELIELNQLSVEVKL